MRHIVERIKVGDKVGFKKHITEDHLRSFGTNLTINDLGVVHSINEPDVIHSKKTNRVYYVEFPGRWGRMLCGFDSSWDALEKRK